MKQDESIQLVAREMGLVTGKVHFDVKDLAATINDLIANDFQKLISHLYRMDISEPGLRMLLKEKPDSNAGLLIAELMIERQLQKIKSRKESKSNDDIPEDEKW
ncbi:MAG TPA: hypothetical protein VGO58_17110 [Chitinophagaceae bacterium]|jgi:hypothetical protein|nr:hypothetical protein [Chitinophagaceae bacterium]